MGATASTLTAWITGAGGLIGNYLVQTAPRFAPHCQVIGIIRNGNMPSHPSVGRDPGPASLTFGKGTREEEGPNYVIRDGIVVIPRGTTIPDGTVI